MEKCNMICLSTACVSSYTADMLNESAFKDTKLSDELSIHMKGVYGWFIYVPDDLSNIKNIPDDLMKCLKFVNDRGGEWLAFDRDVEYDENDGLEKYDW